MNQVAGGAQYAYGSARDRAEDITRDGRHLADAARERADDLIENGRRYAGEARRHGRDYGRRAVRYADTNRTSTLLGIAAAAFALGFLARSSR
ncbi:hypothetical protein GCM10007884_15990 [Methylobacterium brachythecii]|uniref:CsbD family protein n=1 Tax=Methylobacterium brachythecii TaxID=1176177 RepID=A0ABQ6CZV7_9HYPH|nr:hypothetical protein GCM10007884_15990 [Methylobacterium brachythecii]